MIQSSKSTSTRQLLARPHFFLSRSDHMHPNPTSTAPATHASQVVTKPKQRCSYCYFLSEKWKGVHVAWRRGDNNDQKVIPSSLTGRLLMGFCIFGTTPNWRVWHDMTWRDVNAFKKCDMFVSSRHIFGNLCPHFIIYFGTFIYFAEDLLGGGKAILYRPHHHLELNQPHTPQFNFSLRIFCQQISAVIHTRKSIINNKSILNMYPHTFRWPIFTNMMPSSSFTPSRIGTLSSLRDEL